MAWLIISPRLCRSDRKSFSCVIDVAVSIAPVCLTRALVECHRASIACLIADDVSWMLPLFSYAQPLQFHLNNSQRLISVNPTQSNAARFWRRLTYGDPRVQPADFILFSSFVFLSRNFIRWPFTVQRYNSAKSNIMKSVHWPLMGGLLHLVQRGGD